MKFSAVTLLGFLAAGAMAGSDDIVKKSASKCSKTIWEPAACKPIDYDDKRDTSDLEVRDEELGARGYGYGYPPQICKKKCPDSKVKCTKYGWANGYPRYEGSFSTSVDCKKGGDYTITGTVGPCKYGSKDDCLTVIYKGGYWPTDHKISYLGIYESAYGPKSVKKLNANAFCYGDKCTVPVSKISGYPSLCDSKYYVAVDAGRCPTEPYGKTLDKVTYVKLDIDCVGKKVCKASCCNTY
ncbi:hypothetical protein G7Z17_g7991 [Cylindrodendrum hubeiense]|uniref:Uncharacterized protein n=1 Tax=Cylindrodendrum hubeiense TaxID=595255 RepID=A0A9P5LES7_9HYPO|nr:hypothetical protein G7Z17_g7991 [Cylindrodendrum hubeiense]